MDELETTLRDAREHFPFQRTPPVVGRALPHFGERPRRGARPLLAVVVAAVAIGSGALAVSPAARSEVRTWLDAIPGVDVEQVATLPPFREDAARPYVGEPVSLETARDAVAWPLRLPEIEGLGKPAAIFLRNDVPGGIVTLRYGSEPRALLSQWRGSIGDASYQLVSGRSRVEDVSVGGRDAVWLEGEVQATYTFVGADGKLHREALPVTGNVLLWETDGIAYRLETAASEGTALAVAESLARG